MLKLCSITLLALVEVGVVAGALFENHHRRLSYEPICNYAPQTVVTDHNAIALDQEEIEKYLALASDIGFSQARRVYEEGSHSKSTATLAVTEGLPASLSDATVVQGVSVDGSPVQGATVGPYAQDATTIEVQYDTSEMQDSYQRCQVGGSPDPVVEGCFAADGNVTIAGKSISYSYDPSIDNNNGRTIQGFSTSAETRMRPDQDKAPYFEDFQLFVNYYGTPSYADEWVVAAFEKGATSFSNGNADFSRYGFEGRAEAIKKGTAYMNVAMYVIRELEDAIYDCSQGCASTACNDDSVHALDEAVAFWAGSTEGTDCSGDGHLMAQLADKRCENFKTCGEDGSSATGMSKVNFELLDQFALMQDKFRRGLCDGAIAHKKRIATLLWVPLVQGTLRYAYVTDTEEETSEKAVAEGATFAAAVLPIIHAHDPSAAQTIYTNMKTTQNGSADFVKVKNAFESTYDGMGISCADVGGLYNEANKGYFPGAEPCTDDDGARLGLAIGLPIALVAVLLAIFLVVRRRRMRHASGVEYKGSTTPEEAV